MLMIAFTIILGVSLSTAMLNVMLGVGDKVNRELKIYGANINVKHKDAAIISELYGLGVNDKFLYEDDILKLKTIFWGFNILDFAPILEGHVILSIPGRNNTGSEVFINGTWITKHAVLSTGEDLNTGLKNLRTWWDIQGEWLDGNDENDKNFVMAGKSLAEKFNIHVGDAIRLSKNGVIKNFVIKGIFNDGGNADEIILTDLTVAQELLNLSGKISSIEISALTTPDNDLARKAAQNPSSLSPDEYETWYCTAYVSAICHQIQEVIRDGVARAVRQVAESEGTILNKTTLLMILITILSSIGSALAISNLITASVIERSQELGLLKALGAFNYQIIFLVLSEIILTGLFGGVIGYFLGIGFAQIIGQTIFSAYIEISHIVILITGAILKTHEVDFE